jgi:hypothetical protein
MSVACTRSLSLPKSRLTSSAASSKTGSKPARRAASAASWAPVPDKACSSPATTPVKRPSARNFTSRTNAWPAAESMPVTAHAPSGQTSRSDLRNPRRRQATRLRSMPWHVRAGRWPHSPTTPGSGRHWEAGHPAPCSQPARMSTWRARRRRGTGTIPASRMYHGSRAPTRMIGDQPRIGRRARPGLFSADQDIGRLSVMRTAAHRSPVRHGTRQPLRQPDHRSYRRKRALRGRGLSCVL